MINVYYKRFEKLTARSLKTPLFLSSIASLLDGMGMGLCLILLQRIIDIEPDLNAKQNFEPTQFDLSLNVWIQAYLENATLGTLVITIFIFYLFKSILTFRSSYLVGVYRTRIRENMRLNVLNELSKQKSINEKHFENGTVLTLLGQHIENTALSFNAFMQVLTIASSIIVYILLSMFFSVTVTITSALCGLVLFIFMRRLHRHAKILSARIANLNIIVSERVSRYLQSKAYHIATNQNQHQLKPTVEINVSLGNIYRRLAYQWAIINSIREPYAVSVFVVGIYFFAISLQVDITEILLCFFLMFRVGNLGVMAMTQLQAFNGNSGSLDQYVSDFDKIRNFNKLNKQSETAETLQKISILEFAKYRNYYQRNQKAEFSFSIQNGQCLRINGPSGSGKSSILNDILLLSDNYSGEIKINGQPLNSLLISQYRDQIGYLNQAPIMPVGDIYEHITSGKSYAELKPSEIERVKLLLSKLDLVSVLGKQSKLRDNQLIDDTLKVSGGEQQRLHLARELFREPKLLILDEPTSALDDANRNLVKELLNNLWFDTILIIVSHDNELDDISDVVMEL